MNKPIVGPRPARYGTSIAAATLASGLLLWQTLASSAPLDPASFPSLGPSPFSVSGAYVINTSPIPILSGPTGSYAGFVTNDNVAVFPFDTISIVSGAIVRAIGSRPVALLSRDAFELMSGGGRSISLAPTSRASR
jgi:hypothetical protein